jgi:polysaccharide chain length determinant protein (PEP-CTERM system associated)
MQNEFDYRKYLNLLLRHKRLFAIAALTFMSGAIVICYILPKKYEARSIVFIEKNVLNDLFRGIATTPTVEDTLRGLNSTIKSRTLLTKVINELDLNVKQQSDAQLEATILGLQKNTIIKLDERDWLITVSFIDGNPRLARDYVNTLVRRFIEDNLSVKREASYGATSFLSEQIASYKEKIDKADAEINNYKREKGPLLDEAVSFHTEIGAGQQRLDDLTLRRSQLETARNQLKRNNPARTRLLALQKRLEELRLEYTDNYPEVLKVKADIETAQKEVNGNSSGSASTVSDPQELERVEAELQAVRSSEQSQRALLANTRGLMRESPSARATLEKLLQEKNRYANLYEQLVAKGGQAEVSKQLEVQDKSTTLRIVEPAVMPIKPVSPNRIKIMLFGIVAGFATGFGLLLLIDYFDKTVKTADALKALGVQVLAVIPKISDPQAIEKERRRDLRLYIASGAYFSLIVALLALELLDKSPVERIIGLING